LLLNKVWLIAVRVLAQEMLISEVGSKIANRSLPDVDGIDSKSAEQIERLVQAAWEHSRRFVPVIVLACPDIAPP
jgi:hypothetical protein